MNKPVCTVIGVGPGNGAAFAHKFGAQGYAVALVARTRAYLESLAGEIPGSRAVPCDAADPAQMSKALAEIERELGPIDVLIYNAGSGAFGSIEQVALTEFETAWRVNALGLAAACKHVMPAMTERRQGHIVVIGATASLRGGAGFAAFASAKAAQRSLAQSIARRLGPQGVHVAYVIIDGIIDSERARQRLPEAPAASMLRADDIAESVYFLTRQPPSAWTFELDLRPFAEKW